MPPHSLFSKPAAGIPGPWLLAGRGHLPPCLPASCCAPAVNTPCPARGGQRAPAQLCVGPVHTKDHRSFLPKLVSQRARLTQREEQAGHGAVQTAHKSPRGCWRGARGQPEGTFLRVCSSGPECEPTATFGFKKGPGTRRGHAGDTQGKRRTCWQRRRGASWMLRCPRLLLLALPGPACQTSGDEATWGFGRAHSPLRGEPPRFPPQPGVGREAAARDESARQHPQQPSSPAWARRARRQAPLSESMKKKKPFEEKPGSSTTLLLLPLGARPRWVARRSPKGRQAPAGAPPASPAGNGGEERGEGGCGG